MKDRISLPDIDACQIPLQLTGSKLSASPPVPIPLELSLMGNPPPNRKNENIFYFHNDLPKLQAKINPFDPTVSLIGLLVQLVS